MTERGTLITYRNKLHRPEYYVVLDIWFESVILITQSLSLAQYWKRAVDYYEHNEPYTIRVN